MLTVWINKQRKIPGWKSDNKNSTFFFFIVFRWKYDTRAPVMHDESFNLLFFFRWIFYVLSAINRKTFTGWAFGNEKTNEVEKLINFSSPGFFACCFSGFRFIRCNQSKREIFQCYTFCAYFCKRFEKKLPSFEQRQLNWNN